MAVASEISGKIACSSSGARIATAVMRSGRLLGASERRKEQLCQARWLSSTGARQE